MKFDKNGGAWITREEMARMLAESERQLENARAMEARTRALLGSQNTHEETQVFSWLYCGKIGPKIAS